MLLEIGQPLRPGEISRIGHAGVKGQETVKICRKRSY
jgi:hypothetical protein